MRTIEPNKLTHRLAVIAAVLCLFCATACQHAATDTNQEESVPDTAAVFDEASVLDPAIKYLDQLDEADYEKAATPDPAPLLRWDFSQEDLDYLFNYEQKMSSIFNHGFEEIGRGPMEQDAAAKGFLQLDSKGDHTADFVLKDMTMTTVMSLGSDAGKEEENEPKEMTMQSPPIVIQGMQEDGSASYGCGPQEALLKLVFPLPPEPLKVGESVDLPMSMPFNAMGSLLQVKGRNRVKLARYVLIDGRVCACLETDINISDMDVPEAMEGEYACISKGKSIFYFDVKARKFVSGQVAMVMTMKIDAPMPKIDFPKDIKDKVGDKMPESFKTSMIMDTLITISPTE